MPFSLRSKMRLVFPLVVIFLICLTLLISVKSKVGAAGSPHLTLSPTSGLPGYLVVVNGTSFSANQMASIYYDGTQVATITTSANGTFSLTISIPVLAAPGNHLVRAYDDYLSTSASATFLVRANWTMYGASPEHRGVNTSENVLTTANISGLSSDWSYATGGNIYTSPAIVNGVAYVGSEDNSLYALDATTGAFIWSYTTQGAIDSSPAVVNGIVYVGSDDKKLYALNAVTGKRKWSYVTGGAISSSPTVANGLVYIGSSDGKLYALDAITGAFKWSYTTRSGISTSPAIALPKGIVYVGSDKLYALDAVTGTLKWSYPIPGAFTSPVVSAIGIVYIGSDKMYALNGMKGTLLWSYATGGCSIDAMPAIHNNVIYFGTSGGYYGSCTTNNIFAVNATTGAIVWSIYSATEDTIESSPIVVNGIVYIVSNDHDHTYSPSFFLSWLALNATNGAVLKSGCICDSASDAFPGLVPPSPVVVNGILYVGSTVGDGELYTFHLPSTTL